jgi:hypothetical protein
MHGASATSSAWAFDRDDPERLRAAAVIARERRVEPDLELAAVSARGDVITVQIVRGELRDPAALLYLEQQGLFELVRIEPWPGGRTLLVLRSWQR